METVDFSQPIRQSSRGIIIIFALHTIRFFRNFFAVFLSLGILLVRKNSFISLTPMIIILVVVGILMIILIISILNYLNFKFHIDEDDFHLATGIINKNTTIIPKSKIQNVYIKQNFLQQLINVVSLNIETAGDNKSEIEIKALNKSTALQLKGELFAKLYVASKDASTKEIDDVFFKISIKRLLLEGLLQNHLKSFLIMASFVVGIYYQSKEYVSELDLTMPTDQFNDFQNDTLFKLVYFNVAIIAIVLLVSLLFSVIRIFIVNYQLEVIEHQKTIEINKGLFNKVSLSLKPEKIQNLVIKTNYLKNYFNLYSLQVKQAMTNKKLSKSLGVIALEREQIDQLIAKLLLNYHTDSTQLKPEPYYKRILFLRTFLPIIVANIIAIIFFDARVLFLNFLLVPIALVFLFLRYKKAYYQISDTFITIGSGAFDTVTNILEINKIQSVSFKQSFFQKRKKIASVEIYTASKPVTILYVKEQEAKSISDFLLFRVESQGKDWM